VISPSVFSWKKRIYKKLRCNSSVKIWFGRKKILNYAYVLKNGVGRYNIFFLFLHKACWILLFVSFSYRIRQCFCFSTIRFVPCVFFINKQFHTCANAFPNEFTVRSYEYCAGKHWIGFKKIKQRRISFVLGYLPMILWKISTAISIKHRILATFNIKKNSILTACMHLTSTKVNICIILN
jgi:hypothetical protein